MSGQHSLKAIRGNFRYRQTVEQPEEIESHLRFIEDGLMLLRSGKVEWFGTWQEGKHLIPEGIRVRDYSGK